MPGEITITPNMSIEKGSFRHAPSLAQFQEDMASDERSADIQSIPTTAAGTAINFSSSLTGPAVGYWRNLDDENFVDIGRQVAGVFYACDRIEPGATYPIKIATLSLFALADTAPVALEHDFVASS